MAKRNPFAGYKDFKACVRSKSKTKGVKSPKRLCGWLKKRTENPEEEHPDSFEMAQEVAEGFHGRLEGTVTELQEEERYASNLANLGYMEDMEVEAPSGRQVIGFPEFPLTKRPKLCSSPDADQLYLVGGKQELTHKDMEALGIEGKHDYVVIGEIVAISYVTAKYHLARQDKKMGTYRHEFGEEGGEPPLLVYDAMNKRQLIVGGSYTIEDEGIRD